MFCKTCPVPYALREAVEVQLNKMESDGVITPVSYAKWASPTVHISKMDQSSIKCLSIPGFRWISTPCQNHRTCSLN